MNARARSARSRPLAAARGGLLAAHTRPPFFVLAAFGLDLQGVGSTFFVPAAFVLDLQGVVSSKCP